MRYKKINNGYDMMWDIGKTELADNSYTLPRALEATRECQSS